MTEKRDRHRPGAPLESWALELEGERPDSSTCEELSQVVALLRDLPEPEPPSGLVPRILERVAEERSRPGVLHTLFGLGSDTFPRIGMALAAGVAGLFVITASSGPPVVSWFGPEATPPAPTELRVVTGPDPGAVRRRSPVLRPQFVSAYSPSTPRRSIAALERASIHDAFDSRLDHQLNQLMLDPTAFAVRLERMAQRDAFVARLAERAAQRGDAPEIALSVRRSNHPLARQIVQRMLRATMVARTSR